jgi:hypothetical protein
LNSVHGVYLHDDVRTVGKDLLALASLNSVTLLGAETVGRAYGGGMLKIEPREADLLPMPSPAMTESVAPSLRELRPTIRRHLAQGRLEVAVRHIDSVVLTGALGMSEEDLAAVRADHALLTARRIARGKGD